MHKALMTNLEQARALFNPNPTKFGIKEHPVRGMCQQMKCKEIHLLGGINRNSFNGDDVLWGLEASGILYGDWNFHRHGYDRLWGSFPMPDGGHITEDYSEILKEPRL
jgi:hypothetical protein